MWASQWPECDYIWWLKLKFYGKKGEENVELHKPEAEPARLPWLFVDDHCNLNEWVFILWWSLIGKYFV